MNKQHALAAGRVGVGIFKTIIFGLATVAVLLGSIVMGLAKALSQAKR